MGKPTIIDYFRNITFIVFILSIIAVAIGYNTGIIFAAPYILMEICAILHRLCRFRTKQIEAAGSERQMKYSGYFIPRHNIDMKFVAFFRRIFLTLTIGVIIKIFLGNYNSLLWVPGLLIILNVITFIKAWYIFRTKWEGAYSVFTLYGKQISTDFTFPITLIKDLKEHNSGTVLRLIVSVIVIILTVGLVIFYK